MKPFRTPAGCSCSARDPRRETKCNGIRENQVGMIVNTQATCGDSAPDSRLDEVLGLASSGLPSCESAYNAQGEAYRRAIDLNRNGEIDAADRVTDTLQEVVAGSPIGAAIRTTSILYDLANNPVTIATSYRSPDGLLTRQETLGIANPATSAGAVRSDRADGAWADTSTNPDGTKTTVTYQNWLPVTQTRLDTGNNVIASADTGYDALRRPEVRTGSRTAAAVVTRTAYHATNGLVVSVTDDLTTGADRVTSFVYDSMGRRSSTTLPDNTVSHTSYWPGGQEKAAWGSQTNPTVKIYSPAGQLTELRTFRSANLALVPDETTGGYDATSWIYNDRNQLERKEYADGKGTDYSYTAAGRLETRTWARSAGGAPLVTTYGYNNAGELENTGYSDTTPGVTIVIDKLGRQQSVTNGLATSTFGYDPATLALDTETIAYDLDRDGTADFTRVLDRKTADASGRDKGWELKDGTTVENEATYGYSATDGRLKTVADAANSFTYGYESGSDLLATVVGPAHTVTNHWEPDRDVLDLKENKAGATLVSSFDYTVNALGQRTNVATAGSAFPTAPSWIWDYDSLGQVISADSNVNSSDRSYQYDAIGNRKKSDNSLTLPTSDNYTSNGVNQYTAVGAVTPGYDFDGNATAYPLPTAPGANSSLVWDAENRLIETQVTGGGPLVKTLYDAQSRRIAETVGAATTLYIYDGWNCIAEYAGGTLAKTRLWGLDLSGTFQGAGGVGGLLAETHHTGTAAAFYPTYDGNGNISEYLDTTGQTIAHFEYDPFGNTVVNTDTSNQFAYRFSTKPLNFATGFYYYGYRWYDPQTGSWPSRDPMEERGGVNLYGFVENDSLEKVDRLGMLVFASGFTVIVDDLKGGMILELTPGNKALVPDNSLGVALLKYEIIPDCEKCDKSGKYRLKEYHIIVFVEIHLRKSYDTADIRGFATNTADVAKFAAYSEQQHATDYINWSGTDEVMDAMNKVERKAKIATYKDQPDCITRSIEKFLSDDLLNRKAKDAVVATKKKYDSPIGGREQIHKYPGEGNWGKGN